MVLPWWSIALFIAIFIYLSWHFMSVVRVVMDLQDLLWT
jgi:hypothetical protein